MAWWNMVEVVCQACGITANMARKTARFCLSCRESRRKTQALNWERQHKAERSQYNKDRGYQRAWTLRQYGLTPEDYAKLFKAQDGGCAICGLNPDNSALCVDHCHETGVVRGLLCSPCNRAIGQLGDTAETLQRATDYLKGVGIETVIWPDA